jgi:hypothetical protein
MVAELATRADSRVPADGAPGWQALQARRYVDPSHALLSFSAALGSAGISLLGTVLLSNRKPRWPMRASGALGRGPLLADQLDTDDDLGAWRYLAARCRGL